MNRNRWLIPLTVVLALLAGAYHLWSNWGLVTIHSEKEPLSKIIREIEKQGHVTVKTDLDLSTPIHMNVDKVVVTEALETLATVTDGRWRLAFFVAGDKAAIGTAVASIATGKRPEGWKTAYLPMPPIGDQPDLPPDPRRSIWTVSVPAEPKMQAYLAAAANQVTAMFFYPESWNPDVKNAPKTGPIVKVLPKLASAARGQSEAVFLLQKGGGRFGGGPGGDEGGGRPDGPPPDDASGGGRGNGGPRGFNAAAIEERMKAQIAQLPADQRAKAEAELAERKALFASFKDLTPEERRAKMEEMMSDPTRQEKMETRMASQDARRSPAQRLERSHKYVDRKEEIKNGTAPTGGGGGGAPAGRGGK